MMMRPLFDRRPIALAAVAGIFFWTVAHCETPPPLTPQQIAERAVPSVVRIQVATGLGSGFVVSSDGRIVTNLHVIAGAKEATVVLADGRELRQVEILAADEALDLAVLKVPADKLPALSLGDSSRVKVGQRVVAIGHPLGLSNTVSDGLVSGVRALSPQISVLQLSAPISPGSSGGPLIDEHGQVIGVSTLIINQGQNLNFGMPVNALKPLLGARAGTPLSRYRWKTSGKIVRAVPRHELSVLGGCSEASLETIAARIQTAISVGAPAYNEGNHEGCFRTYAATAVAIDREVADCAGPREALLAGVRKADKLTSFDEKAWAMRDAFDGVLDVLERHASANRASPGDVAGRVTLPRPPPRNVPTHPLKLLDGCSEADGRQIERAIAGAIGVGAPLYNQGNIEACFRIYEGAALQVQRRVHGCAGPKKALLAGVREAATRDSFVDKAWAMRDAFDGLLDLLERK